MYTLFSTSNRTERFKGDRLWKLCDTKMLLFKAIPYTYTRRQSFPFNLVVKSYIDLQLTKVMSVAQSLLLVSVSLYHKEGIQSFRWQCGKMSNKKLAFKKSRILHLQIFLPFSNSHRIKVRHNIFLLGLLVPVNMSDLTLLHQKYSLNNHR